MCWKIPYLFCFVCISIATVSHLLNPTSLARFSTIVSYRFHPQNDILCALHQCNASRSRVGMLN